MNKFLILVGLGGLLAACAGNAGAPSGGTGGKGSAGSSSDAGTGGDAAWVPSCSDGDICECDSLYGETVCNDDGVALCDCSACPDFEPQDTPAFEPCGGEPFGRWQLVESDWSGYRLPFDTGGFCETHGTTEVESDSLRYEFRSGGDAVMAHLGADITYRVKESCAGACEDIEGVRSELTCESSGCGACDCTMKMVPMTFTGTWSREDTNLTFSPAGYAPEVYPYCVEGEQMKLVHPNGRLLTFKKVGVSGVPQPCDERSAETCTLGGGCGYGICEGGTDCAEATNESECGTISGCSWSTLNCVGEAPETCDLRDYGVVPGCEFNDKTVCSGTRTACSDIADDEICSTSPGCEVHDNCVGGETPCSAYDHALSTCAYFDSCVPDEDTGLCGGTYLCEDVGSMSRCELLADQGRGCRVASCDGEAKACSELTIFDCEVAAGCTPVAP